LIENHILPLSPIFPLKYGITITLRLHLPFIKFLERDNIDFIQAEVLGIDVENKRVDYRPGERLGSAIEEINYDYLVIAVGNKLAFDEIEGFGKYGHTFTDTYYGDKIRRHLHSGGMAQRTRVRWS
jgi:sulfide:quinone oxidoreductase